MSLPFLLILSLIANFIAIDIFIPSFPSIANYFNISDGIVQLTIAYDSLGFCIGGLIFGPLSECYGRRKIMVLGNALLFISAICCTFASSIYQLLIFCFIQGIGASVSVVVFAIISDSYQGSKAVKFIGIMNSVTTVILATAPIIGNFVDQTIGWRGNYMGIAILCFISLILLLVMLPETKKHLEVLNLKKIIKSYYKLLSSLKFTSFSLIASLATAGHMSFVTCGPFLYTETFGVSNTFYALNQGIIVASFSIVSLFSSKVLQKLGVAQCIIFGMIIRFISCLLLISASIALPNSPYLVTISMVIFSIGCGICQALIFNLAINIFPKVSGFASSLVAFIKSLVIAIFIWLTSNLYNGKTISVSLIILFAITLEFIFTIYLLYSNQLANNEEAC